MFEEVPYINSQILCQVCPVSVMVIGQFLYGIGYFRIISFHHIFRGSEDRTVNSCLFFRQFIPMFGQIYCRLLKGQ